MKRIFFLYCALACFVFTGVARADDSATSAPPAPVTFVQPDRDIDHSPPAVPEQIQPAPDQAPPESVHITASTPTVLLGPVHVPEAQLENDARLAAEAQVKYEKAKASLIASSGSDATTADSSSTDTSDVAATDATATASTDGQSAPAETHHSMDELVESGSHLGPDDSDSTHHSMESLLSPSNNAPSSTHHTMDELFSSGG